jgi:hypothetical protein
MKWYSGIVENEIKSFSGKQMELENVRLSEIPQTDKDK